MADKLKEIQVKVLEWWNRFTSRQKTIIIGIGAIVIFTFAILIYVFTKPQYTNLITCDTTKDAAEVVEILEAAGIDHEESTDGLLIKVPVARLSDASLALGSAGYAPDDWTLEKVFDGGLTSTASDTQKKYVKYLEKQLEATFSAVNGVKSTIVILDIPEQDGTLIAKTIESSAYIQLELEGDFSADNAAAIARAAATALHNETTANIVVMDTNANLLFSGEEDYTMAGIASTQIELRKQAETMIASQVKKVILGTNQFDMVEVASYLDINFSSYESKVEEYSAPDGRDNGMIEHEEVYESENDSGVTAAAPGTDSNDENTYMFQDNNNSSSAESERVTDYQNNKKEEYTVTPAGGIEFSTSGVSLTAIRHRAVKEEDVKRQGLLDGITWEEYKLANDVSTKLEVDEDFYSIVSTATGIPVANITIVAYEEPVFFDAKGLQVSTTDVLSIVMLVVILGLLGFVLFRSMHTKRAVAEEEELSVENLLQSTPEVELEDIDMEAKSETRKMIEKFVDENPEAAANLLRNWLNEDWN